MEWVLVVWLGTSPAFAVQGLANEDACISLGTRMTLGQSSGPQAKCYSYIAATTESSREENKPASRAPVKNKR